MRKNGINRELTAIEGGICAPSGFKAGGIHCGFSKDSNKKDLAMILSDRSCPTACVFSKSYQQSGPASATKKHLKNGIARAILVNSGVANVFQPAGDVLAEKVCRVLSAKAYMSAGEVVIASTGEIGKPLTLDLFEKGIPRLLSTLQASEAGSLTAAEAIMTTDKAPKQFAYRFELGDFSCKIGGIFKGSAHVSPNMATTLAFLTTDVNITSEMLQKALSSAVKDSFNLLSVDGISSPNDTVCIMANGKAGNYKISHADSEYIKFLDILKDVLTDICHKIIQESAEENYILTCKVTGAKSKQSARELAKRLIDSYSIKTRLKAGVLTAEDIIYEAVSVISDINFANMQIMIGGMMLLSEGRKFAIGTEIAKKLQMKKECEISIALECGNYTASSLGCIGFLV